MITRPPPRQSRPPFYAVAGRAFGRSSMRPVIITSCILGIIWSLIWATGAFQDLSGDKQNNDLKKLTIFDIILGSLYAAVTAIQFFGLVTGITRRVALARLFVGLSALAVALVGSAELIRTIVHFAFKNALINECTRESTGDTVRTSFAFWGGVDHTLSQADAQHFCQDVYSRRTFSTIAWLILVLLLSSFFASAAYSYYRQLLDPNAFRTQLAPSDQFRLDALRYNQQQPYGGGYAAYPGANTQPGYAPPAGPPPPRGYDAPPYESGPLPEYGSEFAARDMGDEKSEDKHVDGTVHHIGAGPSETDLNHRL